MHQSWLTGPEPGGSEIIRTCLTIACLQGQRKHATTEPIARLDHKVVHAGLFQPIGQIKTGKTGPHD